MQDGQHSTTLEVLQIARAHLGKLRAPIGAGTNGDLYQLHLQRPPIAEADFVFWSMNPQVHAFDNRSMAETPEMATCQIRAVQEYFPGKPICISPVTLKPRGIQLPPRLLTNFPRTLTPANCPCSARVDSRYAKEPRTGRRQQRYAV